MRQSKAAAARTTPVSEGLLEIERVVLWWVLGFLKHLAQVTSKLKALFARSTRMATLQRTQRTRRGWALADKFRLQRSLVGASICSAANLRPTMRSTAAG